VAGVRPLNVLRERNFALLIAGHGLSTTGDMMERVARLWLVFELTDSALALAIVGLAHSLPRLVLGVMAGTIADRVDRRKLLFVCYSGGLVVQLVFATLVFTKVVVFWQIVAVTLVASTFHTLSFVARHSLIPDLVPKERVPDAVAMQSAVHETLNVIANAIGGVLILIIGVAGVLYLNAVSFAIVMIFLGLMRLVPHENVPERPTFRADVALGLRFAWSEPRILGLVGLRFAQMALLDPYRTFMPVLARDVLHVGPAGYGLLLAAPAAGGVAAVLFVAFLGSARRGLLMLLSLILASLSLVVLMSFPSFVLAVALLALTGVGQQVHRLMSQTLLQLLTPRSMLGRVMGLVSMDRGFAPAGGLLLGALADFAGVPIAISVGAATCALLAGSLLATRPVFRRL
jgi:hypothetical protein